MLTIEYKSGVLHLTAMGSTEEVYDSLAKFNSDRYAVNGVCYEDHKELVFGFFINNNLPFVIEGNRNDVSLYKTMERAWGKPQCSVKVIRDSGYSDSRRNRRTN